MSVANQALDRGAAKPMRRLAAAIDELRWIVALEDSGKISKDEMWDRTFVAIFDALLAVDAVARMPGKRPPCCEYRRREGESESPFVGRPSWNEQPLYPEPRDRPCPTRPDRTARPHNRRRRRRPRSSRGPPREPDDDDHELDAGTAA